MKNILINMTQTISTYLHGFVNFLKVGSHLEPVFFLHRQLVRVNLRSMVVQAGKLHGGHGVNRRGNGSRNHERFLGDEAKLVTDA